MFPDAYAEHVMPVADQVDFAALVFRLLTFVAFGRWIYMAGRNLVEAGYQDLEFTPGSRIWWFAVPFANLVKPYQGMRELWNASHGEGDYTTGNGLVGAWWALWLLHGFIGGFLRLAGGPDAGTGPLWFQSAARHCRRGRSDPADPRHRKRPAEAQRTGARRSVRLRKSARRSSIGATGLIFTWR